MGELSHAESSKACRVIFTSGFDGELLGEEPDMSYDLIRKPPLVLQVLPVGCVKKQMDSIVDI